MVEKELPIFPLPNVVFFPKAYLPLHIFEPRYKRMVADAVKAERKIGIVLLEDGWQTDYFGSPPVHRIGCMGTIEVYEKLPDGRYNILLHGLDRFEVIKFIKEKPYRRAQVKILHDSPLRLELYDQKIARESLLNKYKRYIQFVLGIEADDDRLDWQAPLETVVNQIAAALDIPVNQKQELLETMKLEKRLSLVTNIVDDSLNHANKLRQVVGQMRFIPDDPELN